MSQDAPTQPPLVLTFQYMPAVKLIVAAGRSPAEDRLLHSAFPEDTGSLSAIESVQHLLALEEGAAELKLPGNAKPYR